MAERDAATAGAACRLAAAGIQVVRVHAAATVRAALDRFASGTASPDVRLRSESIHP